MSQSHDKVISSKSGMVLADVIQILVQHHCRDVTSDVNQTRFSQYPVQGGGFGDIYTGEMKDGMKVAVKCARYCRPSDMKAETLINAARELYAWSKCQHPNILELVGLSQHQGQLAIISPWMENDTLPKYIAGNPEADRLDLCRQVARGLAYLHDLRMIHGDLKGENVLICNAGTAKLADFGNVILKEYTLQFTGGTGSLFTPRWAAPEILNRSPHSAKSDVYSLGMTILETATGKVPYHDISGELVPLQILYFKNYPTRDDASIQIQGNKDLLWELMAECWNHEASSRPQATEVDAKLGILQVAGHISNNANDASRNAAVLVCLPNTLHQHM